MVDLFRGPVLKNPSSNAGDVGLTFGQRTKIPHAAETAKPTYSKY